MEKGAEFQLLKALFELSSSFPSGPSSSSFPSSSSPASDEKTHESFSERLGKMRWKSPEYVEEYGMTPLMVAILDRKPDAVLRGLATPEMLNRSDKEGHTPLLYASVSKACTRAFLLLLELGADPSIESKDGSNPLRYAVMGGCHDRVQLILNRLRPEVAAERIMRPNKDLGGRNLLGACLECGNDVAPETRATVLSLLLMVPGVYPDAPYKTPMVGVPPYNRLTPLHTACLMGLRGCVLALLSAGADPSRPKEDGWTPLHLAAFNGHFEIVSLLLSRGADVYAKTPLDTTPSKLADMTARKLAKKEGHGKIQRYLRLYEQSERLHPITSDNDPNESSYPVVL